MPWVPLQESGVTFEFGGGFAPAVTVFENSIASMPEEAPYGGEWYLQFPDGPVLLRVTASQYSTSYDPSGQYAFFFWGDPGSPSTVYNTAAQEASGPDTILEFLPVSFETGATFDIAYGISFFGEGVSHSNNIETYQFLIEIWEDDPPDPDPEPVLPWWLCVPKDPPEPCPVRPTGFVPFSEYDEDFKYPLASSRVPSQINRPDDCVVCAPTIIEGEVIPPEPVCVDVNIEPLISSTTGAKFLFSSSNPAWFGSGSTVTLTTPSVSDSLYSDSQNGYDGYSTNDGFIEPAEVETGTIDVDGTSYCVNMLWNTSP